MKVLTPIVAMSVSLFMAIVTAAPAQSQEDQYLEPAQQTAEEINESAQQSQDTIDNIAGQIDSKLQQYKTLMKEMEGLEVYNGQLRRQIQNQQDEMQSLNDAIDEVSVIERQITPLMIKMIAGLEQFISLDTPFLEQERQDRIADLQIMMDRADVAPSEKFRRVMEAFQVEMDYGRTIEAYSGLQSIDGQDREVEFLRIGRTALLYQTRDASRQGLWNKQTRQWEELDSSYRTQVTKGLRIAKKQLAPDLLMVPVAITD
jgi:DNA repair exonuclease SbcCD ATPase subunit